MSSTLVLDTALAAEMTGIAAHPRETAGVLLVSVVTVSEGHYRLIGREYHPVTEEAYLRRTVDGLTITPEGYVPALGRAEALGATAIWVHTHPGSHVSPSPSRYDQQVDRKLAEPFRLRSGSDYYGALIVSPGEQSIRFTGHITLEGSERSQISRAWIVGERFELLYAEGHTRSQTLAKFDRNVRAFGPAIQTTLAELTIGVVGCGGTGSAVAEQLARLGVRNFILIDPDSLSESNVTRVYGSGMADVGQFKVDIAERNLKRISADIDCEPIRSTITSQPAARRLATCDLVFGCTDDNAGRLILSRIPTYLLTPVIDCGVLLSSSPEGKLIGIDGRVTVVTPGGACLLCRNRVDLARAAADFMTPDERKRREDEGYAPALGQVEPAVVTFTSMVASAAVAELLERLIGYGDEPRPGELLLRFHDREISTNVAEPKLGHYCHPQSHKMGRGAQAPFLDMAWTS